MPIKRVLAPRIDFSVLRRELKLPREFPAEAMAAADAAARGTADPAARKVVFSSDSWPDCSASAGVAGGVAGAGRPAERVRLAEAVAQLALERQGLGAHGQRQGVFAPGGQVPAAGPFKPPSRLQQIRWTMSSPAPSILVPSCGT